MARSNRGQGPQQPVKGFRPGKEPPQLRRQQAKQQYGHLDARQQRLVEMFAGRTPDESRAMMRRWRLGLLAGATVLALAAALLFGWSMIAGVICLALAVALLIVWWRLNRQREALETMADAVSGVSRGRKRR